jgi:4-hydroxyacetophenone monooxygenase
MSEITRDAISNADIDRLDEFLAYANLPSLLMVLYHMTGESKWLSDPYLPLPPRGMSDNDSGGLSDAIQAEIREAARVAIIDWARGGGLAIPTPNAEELRRMMAVCAAESEIPDNYAAMMSAELGFAPARDVTGFDQVADQVPPGFRVVVLGAGIGGLLTAYLLKQAGIPHVVLEKNADVGGTWQTHHYPGAGVDTPSYLYSFSFFHRDWSGYFPKQAEVLEYLRDFADHFDLRPSIRFGVEVTAAHYDEELQRWHLDYVQADGRPGTVDANAVVSAVGLFGQANLPSIPGMESFRGDLFHSTQWPAGLDVRGKRVAVVGSGATAMQVVPAIADEVQSLTIFQKSAMWVAPSEQYFKRVPDAVHWLFNHIPFYRHWYRFQLSWVWNDQVHPSLIQDPEWEHPERSMNARNDRHREFFTRYITDQLSGREDLVAKAMPDYPAFGKRMLVDNGWYAALNRPHVELLDERLSEVAENAAVGDGGTRRDVDVIAMCTGYQTSRFLAPMEIRGRGGRSLREEWNDDDARAYLGITVPGYPNFFMIYGPNTNGSGGSFYSFAEAQVNYIMQVIKWLAREEAGAVEPRAERALEYNRLMDDELSRMVWAHPRVHSYYRNARGRITANRPWSVVDYWTMTRRAHLDDFDVEAVRAATCHEDSGVLADERSIVPVARKG